MPARTVARATLAFLLAALAVTGLTSPGSAGQAPPEVIVSARLVCGETQADDTFEITIVNPGAQTYQVQVDVDRAIGQDESIPVTLDPGGTETVVVEVFGTPMDVFVGGDGDFPDQQLDPVFHCPALVEVFLTTTADTPVEFDDPCINTSNFEMPHGRVEPVPYAGSGPERLRYIPDPGFVGVDDHTISCVTSMERDARIVVTVNPAQAPPAEPVPEPPTFTG